MNIIPVDENEIIKNSRLNTLYQHEFEKGRFFQVVQEDGNGCEVKLAPRTMFKVVYLKENNDLEGIEIIKVTNDEEKQKIRLNKFNLAQLKAFLSFISQIDLTGITERRIKLSDGNELDEPTIEKIKILLSQEGGEEIVETLIAEGIITSKDIVNTSYRKKGLEIYSNLIIDITYYKRYASENGINDGHEEKVWQYFFERNQWIFGYGLEYKFKTILQREAHISEAELDGSNTVITDYLMGDKLFTTFVELKKPSTKLFGVTKNRSNSWRLSDDLINAVSQILEQKPLVTSS